MGSIIQRRLYGVIPILIVTIAALVVGTTLLDGAEGATIRVGPDETYTKIQPAIDNATSGDILVVANGTYHEDLNISKTIDILGSSMVDTIVNGTGSGSVITITASNVNVSGLSIRDSGSGQGVAGIRVIDGANCTFTDLDCSDLNGSGIRVDGSSENTTIIGCVCSSNVVNGITISYGVDILVRNNTCSNNTVNGIDVGKSTNVTVRTNWCWHNEKSGISLSGQDVDCVVEENSCQFNVNTGVAVWQNCGSCQILNNICSNRTMGTGLAYYIAGIWVIHRNDGLVVDGNTIYDHFTGIKVFSNGTTVNNNTCGYNGKSGIDLGEGPWPNQWYNNVTNNTAHHNGDHGIFVQCAWTTVANNTLYSNAAGVLCTRYGHNSTLEDNVCYDNRYGMFVANFDSWPRYVFDVTIRNNTLGPNNNAGLRTNDLRNCRVVDNNCSNNGGGLGIDGIGIEVYRNVCYNNEGSGLWFDGKRFTVIGNNASSNRNGLYFSRNYREFPNPQSTIRNNVFNDNEYYGMEINTLMSGEVVEGNLVCGNTRHGIYIFVGRDVVVANNTLRDNYNGGLHFNGVRNGTVENNTIDNSTFTGGVYYYLGSGLAFGGTHNVTIVGNIVTRCTYGIILAGTSGCLVYNNWFDDNTENWYDPYDNRTYNTWNVSRTPGENICGYPFLGGNYWSDYDGVDWDGDGIGDTKVPYGPGDHLPLLRDKERPTIDDTTVGQPTTGDPFDLTANVTDNLRLVGVWLKYWFTGENATNVSLTVGDNDTVEHTIPVPSYMDGSLHYRFIAVDKSKNWNVTVKRSIAVIDDDLPEASYDGTARNATTGDEFWFKVEAWDNVAMAAVWVEYWYGNGQPTNELLENNGSESWSLPITIDDTLDPLHFRFRTSDRAGNMVASGTMNATILDNDPPFLVEDKSPHWANTGEMYVITLVVDDNIAVEEVTVEYWFSIGAHQNGSLVPDGSSWTHSLSVPTNASPPLSFIACLVDTSGNRFNTSTRTAMVRDVIPPTFVEDMSSTNAVIGRSFTFQVRVTDNHGVDDVMVEYWYSPEDVINVSIRNLPATSLWTKDIYIIETAQPLHYFFYAIDYGANSVTTQTREVAVEDPLGPVFQREWTEGIATTGDPYELRVEVSDNLGVREVWVEFAFGGGTVKNASMNAEGDGNWTHQIDVPTDSVDPLRYLFIAMDTSGNTVRTQEVEVPVTDNDGPLLASMDHPDTVSYGLVFEYRVEAEDNIGVEEVWIIVTGPDSSTVNLSMELEEGPMWTIGNSFFDIGSYTSVIWARDTAGNAQTISGPVVTVVDGTSPSIGDPVITPDVQKEGELTRIAVDVIDKYGVQAVHLVILGPDGEEWNRSMVNAEGDQWFSERVYNDVGTHTFTIHAQDESGNWAVSPSNIFQVQEKVTNGEDPDPDPQNGDHVDEGFPLSYLIGLIAVLVIVLVIVLMVIRSRSNEG